MKNKIKDTSDREISAMRIFDAPCELVFEMWTNSEHIAQWWGPDGFTNTIHEMDVRSGGTWRLTMHGPDGVDYPNLITYIEVKKPERLVYTHGTGQKDDADEFEVTVMFQSQGKKTRLSIRSLFKTAAARDKVVEKYGAIKGLNQTLGRLEKHLAKDTRSAA